MQDNVEHLEGLRVDMTAAAFAEIRICDLQITQATLARLLGIATATVQNYEQYRTVVPGPVALAMQYLKEKNDDSRPSA